LLAFCPPLCYWWAKTVSLNEVSGFTYSSDINPVSGKTLPTLHLIETVQGKKYATETRKIGPPLLKDYYVQRL